MKHAADSAASGVILPDQFDENSELADAEAAAAEQEREKEKNASNGPVGGAGAAIDGPPERQAETADAGMKKSVVKTNSESLGAAISNRELAGQQIAVAQGAKSPPIGQKSIRELAH